MKDLYEFHTHTLEYYDKEFTKDIPYHIWEFNYCEHLFIEELKKVAVEELEEMIIIVVGSYRDKTHENNSQSVVYLKQLLTHFEYETIRMIKNIFKDDYKKIYNDLR